MISTKKFSFKKFMLAFVGVIVAFCSIISILPQRTMSSVYAADEQYTDYTFVGGNFNVISNSCFTYTSLSDFINPDPEYPVYRNPIPANSALEAQFTTLNFSFDIVSNSGNVTTNVHIKNTPYAANLFSSVPVVTHNDYLNLSNLSDDTHFGYYFENNCDTNYYKYTMLFCSVDYNINSVDNFFVDGVYSFSLNNFLYLSSAVPDYANNMPCYFFDPNNVGTPAVRYTSSDFTSESFTESNGLDRVVFTYFDNNSNSISFTLDYYYSTYIYYALPDSPGYIESLTFPVLQPRSYLLKTGDNYNSGYSAGYIAGYETGSSESYNSGYDLGYSNGYGTGRSDGINIGKDTGYNTGYSAGATAGYQQGYAEGLVADNPYTFSSLFGAVLDAPVQTLTGLFNFSLLGVNLLGLFTGLLTLAVIIWIIKMALGGK